MICTEPGLTHFESSSIQKVVLALLGHGDCLFHLSNEIFVKKPSILNVLDKFLPLS